ncbi:MAG TPA: TlpA disulfide reductase family protein [Gemmatimonadales bacterium]|nr:TlpA disulfide reductase family protein [Gemmatimonadales bacterium]
MRTFAAGAVLLLALVGAPRAAAAQDEGIAVGAPAPAVTIADLDGHPVDLGNDIGRRPVFLEFWATWCELCKALYPRMEAAAAKYGSKVAFYGINVTVNQTPARVRRYLAEHHPPFRTLYDADGVGVRAYQAPTTSFVVIVDRHGKVVYTGSGGDQDLDAALARVTAN